jgi:hypothetical protein
MFHENRIPASRVEPGDYVHGIGRVASVQHYPNDPRFSARLTFADGGSTMCGPTAEFYVSKEASK